ncbi:hypothetical protein [Noviherbaspirillum humi]|uniref:hypothetical protein n=1 Tax=Noviherbaspirillum humi TaxID=1688639 RepID=UPI001160B0A5|nr:hypothetical protein [Noviherbaspirillum humi]
MQVNNVIAKTSHSKSSSPIPNLSKEAISKSKECEKAMNQFKGAVWGGAVNGALLGISFHMGWAKVFVSSLVGTFSSIALMMNRHDAAVRACTNQQPKKTN